MEITTSWNASTVMLETTEVLTSSSEAWLSSKTLAWLSPVQSTLLRKPTKYWLRFLVMSKWDLCLPLHSEIKSSQRLVWKHPHCTNQPERTSEPPCLDCSSSELSYRTGCFRLEPSKSILMTTWCSPSLRLERCQPPSNWWKILLTTALFCIELEEKISRKTLDAW